jgi:hypothetical protein
MENKTSEIKNYATIYSYLLLFIFIQTIALNLLNTFIILFLIKNKSFSNVKFLCEILSDKWPFGKPMCLFFKTFDYSSSSLSLILLLIITTHRYEPVQMAVCWPYMDRQLFNVVYNLVYLLFG